ncbi:MAG: FtsW/RodA/SpoVE family cell cycle protein, partial [FCB group bacterium]
MYRKPGHIDWYILIPVVGLMLFSISFVYSASASFAALKFGFQEALFINHAIRIGIGIIVLLVFAKIDYHYWAKFSKILIIIAIGLLIFVLIGGQSVKGAQRWINFGFIKFQPSEFAKFALVLHLAVLLSKKQDTIKNFKEGLSPLLIWSAGITFLVLIQPNHSTAFVILLISITMMFIGNANLFQLGMLSSGAMGLFTIYAVTSKYPIERISAFFGQSSVSKNALVFNYQLQQS